MISTGNIWLIALGANIPSPSGNPKETLITALDHMRVKGFKTHAVSRFYRSAAYPSGSGPDYINACIVVEYNNTALATLRALNEVEEHLGRVRHDRWGARVIDLDILAGGDAVLPDMQTHDYWRNLATDRQAIETPMQIILPHPRIQDRNFVLFPLADIVPTWRHPVLGLTVMQMLERLPASEKNAIHPLTTADCDPPTLALGHTSS